MAEKLILSGDLGQPHLHHPDNRGKDPFERSGVIFSFGGGRDLARNYKRKDNRYLGISYLERISAESPEEENFILSADFSNDLTAGTQDSFSINGGQITRRGRIKWIGKISPPAEDHVTIASRASITADPGTDVLNVAEKLLQEKGFTRSNPKRKPRKR